MKAVVAYESIYGNTRHVAEAIAEGLAEQADVELLVTGPEVVEALGGADLLVVGGPTHVHGMTSNMSRKAALDDLRAAEKAGVDAALDGEQVRTLLERLPDGTGRHAAAFDTRIDKPLIITGSAARKIGKRLRRHHYELVAEPESFLVSDTGGPLLEGELERARAWGAQLAAALQPSAGTTAALR